MHAELQNRKLENLGGEISNQQHEYTGAREESEERLRRWRGIELKNILKFVGKIVSFGS